MKYFCKHSDHITLKTDNNRNRIFSVFKKENGSYKIIEECDAHFDQEYTKEQILEMIDELKKWVLS